MGRGAGRLYGGFDEGPIPAELVTVDNGLFDGLFAGEDIENVQEALDFLDDNVLSNTDNEAKFLLLDQTSPQMVDNGTPTFNEGLTANAVGATAITANGDIILKTGRRLFFDG